MWLEEYSLAIWGIGFCQYSQTCVQQQPLGPPKNGRCLKGGHYSEAPPIKLVLNWDAWESGWSLLTGSRCSEVVVNTGLTVFD
jgi:hypothetical protein